jgi:hypothetical protein
MEQANRAWRCRGHVSIASALVAAAALVVLLLGASIAKADETGCPNATPTGWKTSDLVGVGESPVLSEEEKKAEYTFTSQDKGGVAGKGIPGLIEYCVYYPSGADPVVKVNAVSGGAQGFDGTFFEDPPKYEAFGFQRGGGNESNIPLDGTTRVMGWATWSGGAPTGQVIVLHINDEEECTRLYGNSETGKPTETCFVQPGNPEEPEEPPADNLTASKDAHPSLQRQYEWEIEKEVDATRAEISGGKATFNYTVTVTQTGHTDGGWLVTGKVKVNNPNAAAVTGVEVEDAIYKGAGELDANAECEVEGGSGGAEIEAESSRSFPYACEYSGEPESGEETNIAEVSWPEQTVGGRLLDEGETEAEAEVIWSEAEIEGSDESVTVEDSLHGLLGTVEVGDPNPTSFEYSEEFEGVPGTCTTYDNEATFLTSTTATEGSAEAGVEVCVGEDLEVSKTAEPSFKRTFPWQIRKKADKEEVKTTGKNATFNYTIEVEKGKGEDSGWLVKGKVKVTNPNDWEPVTVDVADEIEGDANAECSVVGGEEAEIPAEASEEFEYECTYAKAPAAGSQTNLATATWDPEAAHTPEGSASGTAGVEWGEPTTTIDNCVTEVTDTVDGTSTKLEGELCESKTFEESITFPVKSGCVEHTNVAKTTTVDSEETLESEVKVRVCGPVQSGALTMGFWQNKNGQGIITGGHETSKVCDSGTWLRKFPPFEDLSSSASCKKVAEYVTGVIKAANAGGAAMNAMLKGQMLATALDVYFSDPALGGNQIKAPNPLGGQKIDLTQVCKNIPACTTFENTSAAFGGAKSMTVLQILTYAGGKSNSGGSSWYGQVKATQELAKDTFDAINNQVAFEP